MRGASQNGNALVIMLVFVLILAGIGTPMIMRSVGTQKATNADLNSSRLLFVAEAGLHYNYTKMDADPLYAVKDVGGFAWDGSAQEYVSATLQLGTAAGTTSQDFQYRIQYLNASTPVQFADRTKPDESFDSLRVSCRVTAGQASRAVVAFYSYGMLDFGGALISDMHPTGTGGSGKGRAKLGHVVLDGKGRLKQHAIFGDMKANGEVVFDSTPLDETNMGTYLLAYSGKPDANLLGTPNEIPDFTALGGSDQLFDFDRFHAAAAAGAGTVYSTIADFETAMNLANSMGQPLEGIQFLEVDPAVEGGGPKPSIPGGINITGTLVLRFATGTSPTYKVVLDLPVNVNSSDLSAVDFADESTYTSGYPGAYLDPTKKPDQVNIAPAFENFDATSDYPAVMFNNGIVDFHGAVNVSGVVYGPSFIEIENKHGYVQYVNGAVIGGGGIYLEGNSGSGNTAIRYDPTALDKLETMNNKGQRLKRDAFAIQQ